MPGPEIWDLTLPVGGLGRVWVRGREGFGFGWGVLGGLGWGLGLEGV